MNNYIKRSKKDHFIKISKAYRVGQPKWSWLKKGIKSVGKGVSVATIPPELYKSIERHKNIKITKTPRNEGYREIFKSSLKQLVGKHV